MHSSAGPLPYNGILNNLRNHVLIVKRLCFAHFQTHARRKARSQGVLGQHRQRLRYSCLKCLPVSASLRAAETKETAGFSHHRFHRIRKNFQFVT